MAEENEVEGFELPIHRSLTEPLLMGGAPRTFAVLNGTMTAAFVIGLHSVLWLGLGIVLHMLAVWFSKKDPEFFDTLLLHIKDKDYYGA